MKSLITTATPDFCDIRTINMLSLHSRIDAWRNATWRVREPTSSSLATLNPWVTASTVTRIGSAVRSALQQPADGCAIPSGAVVLSIADPSVARLKEIVLRRVAHLQCFMRRLVTLCLGGYADSRGGTCVDVSRRKGGSSFRGEVWNQLSWAKWPLIYVALTQGGAKLALFVDADVLLLRNPFERMDAARLPEVSFHHQEELSTCSNPSCGIPCRINTGFLLVSSASFCREVMRQLHPRRWPARMPLDQDVLQWGMKAFLRREHNVTSCSFPAQAFTGHCSEPYAQRLHVRGIKKINRCNLVSYHATCLTNVSSKLAQLEAILGQVERRCSKKKRAPQLRGV